MNFSIKQIFTTKFSTMSIQIQTNKLDTAGLKANKNPTIAKNHKNLVLEQDLPGTALEGSLTKRFWTSTTFGSLHSGGGIAYGTASCLQHMHSSLNKSKTQRERDFKLKIAQIKVKTDELTIKQGI